MRPLAGSHLRFDAAIIETALLDSVAASDINTDVSVRAQRQTGDFGQGVNGAPRAAFALGILEHAVGALVRAFVRAILADEGLVGADRLDDAHAAVRPHIALDETNAVGANLLLGDVVLVAAGALRTVMGRILSSLTVQHALGTLVHTGAIPIGLTNHLLAESNEVFIGERGVFSFAHVVPP